MMNHVRLFTLAVSLGGVESLIEHPASMTHASVPADDRREAGILDELVRIAVGCEACEDLQEDLDQALQYHDEKTKAHRELGEEVVIGHSETELEPVQKQCVVHSRDPRADTRTYEGGMRNARAPGDTTGGSCEPPGEYVSAELRASIP